MPKLLQTAPSKIHGTGVFAGADLPVGLWIPVRFKRCDSDVHDAFDGGFQPLTPFCFLNHSDNPNSEVSTCVGDDGSEGLYLILLKNVRTGREVTIDYGEEYWNEA